MDDERICVMDCGLAREQLDAARPDSGDREDSALEAAFAHVDACPACAEVVEFRREFDRQVSRVVRDVSIPDGLRERLLAAGERSVQPLAAPANKSPTHRGRRKVLVAVTSAAVLLLAAGGAWLFTHDGPAPLAMSKVQDYWSSHIESGATLASLPAFDGSFDATIQDGRWASSMSAPPLGADIDGDGRHDAAVYAFPSGSGFLVVVEPGRVNDVPQAASALSAQKSYRPVPNVAWTLDGQVYLCYVEQGGPRALDAVLSRVYGAQA
jgi:hypothetical protein